MFLNAISNAWVDRKSVQPFPTTLLIRLRRAVGGRSHFLSTFSGLVSRVALRFSSNFWQFEASFLGWEDGGLSCESWSVPLYGAIATFVGLGLFPPS